MSWRLIAAEIAMQWESVEVETNTSLAFLVISSPQAFAKKKEAAGRLAHASAMIVPRCHLRVPPQYRSTDSTARQAS